MKKNFTLIFSIITTILLIVCLIQIKNLNDEIQRMHTNLSNAISYVDSSVDSISYNITSKLEEYSNLVSDSSWQYENIDVKSGMVNVVCKISAKEYRPKSTEAVMICNNQEYSMILENGVFVTSIPIPLFEESRISSVQLVDDEVIKTQALDWYLTPRYEYFPMLYATYSGSSTGSGQTGIYKKKYNGEISIDIEQANTVSNITSMELVVYIDGKEMERTNIPMNTNSNSDGSTASARAYSNTNSVYPTNFYYTLDDIKEIPFGSTYELYVEVIDENQLHYRALVDYEKISKTGEPDNESYLHPAQEANIYDAHGNPLYVVND